MPKTLWILLLVPVFSFTVLSPLGTSPVLADAAHNHEQEQDATGDSEAMRLVSWLGNFHPAAVHFPIALLIVALPAELLARVGKSEKLAAAGRYCVVLGSVSAIVAAALGWFWVGLELTHDNITLTRHQWLGIITAALGMVLLILCPLSARPDAMITRRLYLASLILAAGLVAVTGFLGGVLVYGADHYAW